MRRSNLEILAYEATPLGDLCLRRRELLSRPGTVITEITLDHQLLMSSHNTVSERALANEALQRHSAPALSVLVAGLGLGYTAAAALHCSRVRRVEVIEFLPAVIGFLSEGLIPLASELLADPRFSVRQGDAYAMLGGEATEEWDLVLIDVDHAPDDHLGVDNNAFYTGQGLDRAKRHLAPGGLLAVWSYADNSPFVEALHATFDVVEVVEVQYPNDLVDEDHSDWLFLARDDVAPSIPTVEGDRSTRSLDAHPHP